MDLHLKQEWRAPALVGVLSFAAGVGAGYFLSSRRLVIERVTTETVDVQVEVVDDDERKRQLASDFKRAARSSFDQLNELANGEDSNPPLPKRPIRWASDTPPKHMSEEFVEPEPDPEHEEEIPTDNWNQEEEEEDRSPDSPYTIHKEEFESGESGYRQTTLEYFAGDDILCDENQVPIYNATQIVGKLEFGHGSGDSDIVYVRNDKLESEFEIVRFTNSYQIEVLGLQVEEEAAQQDLKHSRDTPRFRLD